MIHDTQSIYRGYVAKHIFLHGFGSKPGPELAYCWCDVARAYRRTFNMPDPNPEWYPEEAA
jgi:hypothetical protein